MGSEEYAIFPMTVADLDGVLEIEQVSFSSPWSRDAFTSEILQVYTVYLVTRASADVVAYGGMHVIFEDAHVTNIAVRSSHRGKGLGEQMMEELMNRARRRRAKRITLEVRVSNHTAKSLYIKLGFTTSNGAIRKGYYSDTGEDAIVMWRDL